MLALEVSAIHTHSFFNLINTKQTPPRSPQAKLRRDATDAARRAARCELELKRQETLASHRAADVASLRAALKGGWSLAIDWV